MKSANFYYTVDNHEALGAFLESDFFASPRSGMLVQLFSSLNDAETIRSVAVVIQEALSDAVIIGATTAGEIDQGEMREDGILLSFSLFKTSRLRPFEGYGEDSHRLGQKTAEALVTPETRCVIAFVDGMLQNGEKFLSGFSEKNPSKIPIAGGMSADGMRFAQTLTLMGTNVASNGVVAVAIEGEDLAVSQEYNLSWKPIGRSMEITRSEGNRVYEINGLPIIEIFRDFLGEEVVGDLPVSAIEFPLILEQDGILVARSMIDTDEEGSVVFAGELPIGSKVRFGIGSTQLLAQCREETNNYFTLHTPETLFIYSCAGRKAFLGSALEPEFSSLASLAPLSGFFTYGEFYPSSADAKMLNNTTTVLGLSENPISTSKKPVCYTETKEPHSLSGDALLHLIGRVMEDLEKYELQNESIRNMLDELNRSIDSVLIISKTDLQGKITYVNDHFCTVSGYTEEELIGHSHRLIRHEDTSGETYKSIWNTIQNGHVWEGEIKNRSKTGDAYYVKSFILPIKDDNGEIVEYMGIRENITDLIQTQNFLTREKAFNQMVMETEENIILIMENGMIKKLNKRFFDNYPFSDTEEFASKHPCICELFIPQEGYLVRTEGQTRWYDEVLLHPHRIYKAQMVDKWGKNRIYSVKARELLFEKNVYVIVTFNEITQIENAKIEAERAKNSRTEFLAAMSHEIRTPMNGIIGFVELLESTELDYKQRKYIDIIQNSTKSLLGIINNILDFSKIESGQSQIDPTSVNLHIEVFNHFKLFEANAVEKAITYRLQVDPTIAECLQIDLLRLKQILGNLIGNAIKFTPSGGDVVLNLKLNKATARSQNIRFSIKDNGIGISKEKQERIFEPFAQADGSTTREFGGTGLGLSISSKLLSMMGSALRVQSIPNDGSEFYFDIELPVCKGIEPISTMIAPDTIGIEKSSSPYFERIIDTLDSFTLAYKIEEWKGFGVPSYPIIVLFNSDSVRRMQNNGYKGTIIAVGIPGVAPSEKCIVLEGEQCCSSGKCSYIYTALSEVLKSHTSLRHVDDKLKFEGCGIRVLVAEDQEVNRILTQELLKKFDIFPDFAENGIDAVDRIQAEKYDLVFMDINMPLMNGIDATRHIRQSGFTMPIIALTANAMEGDREKLLEAGLSDYLSKPIMQNELETIIRRYHDEHSDETTRLSASDDPSLIDRLESELGLSRSIIERLFKVYFTTIEDEVDMLEKAISTMDRAVIFDIAHKIVGSSANLRLECAMSAAREMEEKHAVAEQKEFYTLLENLKICIQTLRKRACYES